MYCMILNNWEISQLIHWQFIKPNDQQINKLETKEMPYKDVQSIITDVYQNLLAPIITF